MAYKRFLTLGSFIIPVQPDSGSRIEFQQIGEVERAFDGTLLSDVSGYFQRATVETQEMARELCHSIRDTIRNSPIQKISGVMFGERLNAYVTLDSITPTALDMFRMSITIDPIGPSGSGDEDVFAINVSPSALYVVPGEVLQMSIEAVDIGGLSLDVPLNVVSSNPSIISITGGGLVTAHFVGSTDIQIEHVNSGVYVEVPVRVMMQFGDKTPIHQLLTVRNGLKKPVFSAYIVRNGVGIQVY